MTNVRFLFVPLPFNIKSRFLLVGGVQERLEFEEISIEQQKSTSAHIPHVAPSRRRKGMYFCPLQNRLYQGKRQGLSSYPQNMTNCHQQLHSWYAATTATRAHAHLLTKTLESHLSPIAALDFSEPYGTLVSSSQDDTQPRVWDLMIGYEIGRLRGHRGAVKCIQVEDNLCLTGAEDGTVRLWDLRLVDDDWVKGSLSDVAEEDGSRDGKLVERSNGIRSSNVSEAGTEGEGPCLRLFDGHTKAVTALYLEDECLVNCYLSPSV